MKKPTEEEKRVNKLFQDEVIKISQEPDVEKMIPDIDLKTGEVRGFFIKHKSEALPTERMEEK